MSFGIFAFSESPFASMQSPVTGVLVTGSSLTSSIGSVSITADADITATGIAATSSIGSVVVVTDVSFAVTGSALTLSQGIANGVAWETVDIGTAQTYSDVSTGSSQTWTDVSTGTAQTWEKVDEVEKVA
jgi:hypothetical protein